ncbi:MAG: CoA transferase [Candidatus Rokubacteria bacterium]|nr:CoA transferase [Candidatus Rokubacteria bacterium]
MDPAGPLSGILVVDFTRVIAGPVATQTLADLGADVVKIEHPAGGDDTRGYRDPEIAGQSTFFMAFNRNKRSVALDLSVPEAVTVARDLVAKADIVVENFSAGVMAKYGLDYDSLAALNPRVIYVAGSAYGRDGAYRSRAGYDPVVQAESGFLSLNGFPDGEPVRTGIAMIDVTTGLGLVQACLAALIHRERTGRGQYVEVGLFDTALQMCLHFGMRHLLTGETPTRVGNSSPGAAPNGTFRAKDGPFQLTVAGDRVWRKLCQDVLGRPELVDDPAFATGAERAANKDALHRVLDEIFLTDTRDRWVEKMRAMKVPAGPIRTVAEACESPEVKERDLVRRAPCTGVGQVPVLRSPMRFEKTPVREPFGVPALGEHTETVLHDLLGYDAARTAALRAAGAFGTKR